MGGKKRLGKHPLEFRQAAVARMKESVNITALAEELGIERGLLYVWRRKLDPEALTEGRRPATPEERLRRENERLKRALAEKTLEIDFFKGALQRIAARRRSSSDAIERTSSSKSGK